MRIRRNTVLAVLATAAIAGAAVGVAAYQLSRSGDGSTTAVSTSPGTPSATSTSTSSSPTTASSPTSPTRTLPPATSATTPPPRRALSEANLLVANDYLAAGWLTARVRVGEGRGQATIHRCQQNDPQEAEDVSRIFSGWTEDSALHGNQYAMEFTSRTGSQNMLAAIAEWRTDCAEVPSMSGVVVKAGDPVQVRLADASEGQYWRMTFTQDGATDANLVAVVRTGTRVSVVVAQGAPSAVERVDGALLVTESAARLG